MEWIFCDELIERYDLEDDCCGSCHEDYDEGYHNLCEFGESEHKIKGELWAVCCRVMIELEKKVKALTEDEAMNND